MKRKFMTGIVAGALVLAACGDDGGNDTADSAATGTTSAAAATTTAAPKAIAATGLDTAFGTAGVAATPLSTTDNDRFMAAAAGADGKMYAAGVVAKGTDWQMAVARFDAAGKPDASFGTAGVAVANVAVGGKNAEIARAVVVQSDGKVVIAGPYEKDVAATGDAAKDLDVAVVRFDTAGKLDTTFGTGGIAKLDFGPGKAVNATTYVADSPWGLGALPGRKLVVFGTTAAAAADRTDADYVLAGVTATGTLDTTFGTAGYTKTDLKNSGDSARHVAVQPDGKILASGYSRDGDGVVSPVLIRAAANGQLDTTFGTGGVATAKVLPGVAEAYAVGIQGNNYVLAGYGRGTDTNEKVDLIVYRFTATGQWDPTFGTAGVTRLDLAKDDDRARNLVVLGDGRIVVAGSGKLTAANVDAMVVLLDKDGKLQTGFGKGGYVLSDLGGPADAFFGITASADGKYVYAAGYKGVDANSGGNDDAALARIAVAG